MKNLYVLIALVISCNSSAKIDGWQTIKQEIETYGLNKGDTLVDIGCGNAQHAVEISKFS